jgi:hypothetical protein
MRSALEHAAVDEYIGSLCDEEELGTGDGISSAQEVDFHLRILPSRRSVCLPGTVRNRYRP